MKLNIGDTIGIVSPSHVATAERYAGIIAGIEGCGFSVKTGENLYRTTYGYLASEQERANDFNRMVLDENVKMVFFGGGYGGLELLPYIDFDAIKRNPKFFLSYSDGTSILNAIYSKTGLTTYYGQAPGTFANLQPYNYKQFTAHFIQGQPDAWVNNSQWHSLHDGKCEGVLIGGYTVNFALSVNSDYLKVDDGKKYILFLEDHEEFSSIACVSMFLSHIEQSPFIGRVAGLLFGHYSETINSQLFERLKRFGQKYNVPVAYCDDFGHGSNQAILPIGASAVLDMTDKTMKFIYSGN